MAFFNVTGQVSYSVAPGAGIGGADVQVILLYLEPNGGPAKAFADGETTADGDFTVSFDITASSGIYVILAAAFDGNTRRVGSTYAATALPNWQDGYVYDAGVISLYSV